jgi:hypothetical protein
MRAAAESVAFSLKWGFDKISGNLGKAEAFRPTGGGANSDAWRLTENCCSSSSGCWSPNEGADGKFSDLNMLVAAGGCERTTEEWDAVLRSGGFGRRGITLAHGCAVIEAARI